MSICGGVAGARGKNPVGIFIHNDAGGSACNMAHYKNWLPGHNKADGFAHYYVCSDGTLQAEDDANKAWHCGQTDGNNNYLSIEVCQSMGDLNIFKANEEKALALAAQKCKQYGITPSNSTIRLHKEVSSTACPHRSVEIHGGDAATKAYFIQRIKELMNPLKQESAKPTPKQVPGDPVNNVGLYYQGHSQSLGWLVKVRDGQTAGTTSFSKRLEALRIFVDELKKVFPDIEIDVKAHIQKKGWILYKNIASDTIIGTVGEALRLEAIEIIVRGLPAGKKLMYRVHVQGKGWTGWTEAGYATGSTGMSIRIEAIQIKIVDA